MYGRLVTRIAPVVVAATVALAVPEAPLCQTAGTEGITQGEKFAKAGSTALAATVDAKREVEATLIAYNALVQQPSKDAKGDYKKLLKTLERANAKAAKVKPLADTMSVESEAYYKIWAAQVANITDTALRARGEGRIAASRGEYDGILVKLRDAGAALAPIVKDLTDQINFLGSDLRPEALASLKDHAAKLNAQWQEVFSRTDGAVTAANTFFAPLRAK